MAGGSAHEEPNLVPLLDLVLQLVMFFMVCTSFVMEQVDENVRLPAAQSAKPMADAKSKDVVFLNIDRQGHMMVVGRGKPLTTEEEIASYIQDIATDSRKRQADELQKIGADPAKSQPETLIIIRADRDADYANIYRVMRRCQDTGLRKIQLRAAITLKG